MHRTEASDHEPRRAHYVDSRTDVVPFQASF
jgi:hypothetical protein